MQLHCDQCFQWYDAFSTDSYTLTRYYAFEKTILSLELQFCGHDCLNRWKLGEISMVPWNRSVDSNAERETL